jgi:hypothetical protein
MSNVENPKTEVSETQETQETKAPEQGADMNDRMAATGHATSDVWEGDIPDLPDESYEPARSEVTVSYAHENVSRTEFANAPDVRTDFNQAAEAPGAAGAQTEKIDRSDHNLNPPESPAPDT